MNHFLEISHLTRQEAESIIHNAINYKNSVVYPSYPHYSVANLFYENSTRTRVSFELAAKKFSMPVVNLDVQHSSESKGETINDTLSTLAAMGISIFVIRHSENGLPAKLALQLPKGAHMINAGDGRHAHPSQAILDMMTILEHKPNLANIKIAVVGDILHSRVAGSFQTLCELLGVGQLTMIAPKIWQPEACSFGTVTDSLSEGLSDADVVVCLRVQKERLKEQETLDLEYYCNHFSITNSTLKLARPDAIVMHPGPVNRDIELSSSVADGAQSVILEQVQNGVFARMAIIEAVLD